jgi:hypothetical protein
MGKEIEENWSSSWTKQNSMKSSRRRYLGLTCLHLKFRAFRTGTRVSFQHQRISVHPTKGKKKIGKRKERQQKREKHTISHKMPAPTALRASDNLATEAPVAPLAQGSYYTEI